MPAPDAAVECLVDTVVVVAVAVAGGEGVGGPIDAHRRLPLSTFCSFFIFKLVLLCERGLGLRH